MRVRVRVRELRLLPPRLAERQSSGLLLLEDGGYGNMISLRMGDGNWGEKKACYGSVP